MIKPGGNIFDHTYADSSEHVSCDVTRPHRLPPASLFRPWAANCHRTWCTRQTQSKKSLVHSTTLRNRMFQPPEYAFFMIFYVTCTQNSQPENEQNFLVKKSFFFFCSLHIRAYRNWITPPPPPLQNRTKPNRSTIATQLRFTVLSQAYSQLEIFFKPRTRKIHISFAFKSLRKLFLYTSAGI